MKASRRESMNSSWKESKILTDEAFNDGLRSLVEMIRDRLSGPPVTEVPPFVMTVLHAGDGEEPEFGMWLIVDEILPETKHSVMRNLGFDVGQSGRVLSAAYLVAEAWHVTRTEE